MLATVAANRFTPLHRLIPSGVIRTHPVPLACICIAGACIVAAATSPKSATAATAPKSAATATAKPLLVIDDPHVLATLERGALSFAAVVERGGLQPTDNKRLYRHRFYASIVRSISADLDRRTARDPKLGVTMRTGRRLFNKRWLRSPDAHFELVGVVNRLDRQPFATATCGELRLIYRLSYRTHWRGSPTHSRLPMTVNVVFWLRPSTPDKNCGQVAARWIKPPATNSAGIAAWLTSPQGPLAAHFLDLARQKAVEVNMQSVRWPSTVRPGMGGYAEYMLRVFLRRSNKFTLGPLENTPDVHKLRSSRRLRRALLKWLHDPKNLRGIDDGVFTLPDRFLARRATSFALHGMSRLANRPFDQFLSARDFKRIDFAQTSGGTAGATNGASTFRHLRSPRSLLRRLNDMTCVGCHQNRTVAGFHFLGIDRAQTHAVNAIAAPGSPHFVRDLPRRQRYTRALATGGRPVVARPFSDRSDHHEGDYGSHCGVASSADFRHWTCKTGLTCQVHDAPKGSAVGECLPPRLRHAGAPCRVGVVSQKRDPLADRVVTKKSLPCAPGYHCEVPSVGFPGGMCSDGCQGQSAGDTCGAIAILHGFNRCLGRGKKPFFRCLTDNVRPGSLRRCDSRSPCRDDYVCARIRAGVGGCIPPYFLFQLRVDGHPRPASRSTTTRSPRSAATAKPPPG